MHVNLGKLLILVTGGTSSAIGMIPAVLRKHGSFR